MILSTVRNVFIAALSSAVVATAIHMTSSPISTEEQSANTFFQPTLSSNDNSDELQKQFNHLVLEINDVKSELKALINQQQNIKQFQDKLTQSILSLKDSQNTQNLATSNTPLQTGDNIAESTEEESQLSRLYSLDNQMQELDSDPVWEGEALSMITSGFKNVHPQGSTLQSVECQGATCRIEVTHNSNSDANHYLDRAINIVSWDHKSSVELIENGDDSLTSIYYATREEL